MDMAVTQLFLPDRDKMIENLDLFADNLKEWDLIEDLKAISTASIPVIKAVVDLNKLRDTEMNKDEEVCENIGQAQNMPSETKK